MSNKQYIKLNDDRLTHKKTELPIEISQNYFVTPFRANLYMFFHMLNRSSVKIKWVFPLQLLFFFLHIFSAALFPFATNLWAEHGSLKSLSTICTCIIRYLPTSVNDIVVHVFFIVYAILLIIPVVLFFMCHSRLKARKDMELQMSGFSYICFLALPILRGSMTSIFAFELAQFPRKVSIVNFIISFFALVFFVLELFVFGIAQYLLGTSPSPHVQSSFGIFAPDSPKCFFLEIFMIFVIFVQEFAREIAAPGQAVYVMLSGLIVNGLILTYLLLNPIYISKFTQELFESLLVSGTFTQFVLGLSHFVPGFPSALILVVWVLSFVFGFVVLHVIQGKRDRRYTRMLKNSTIPTTQLNEGESHETHDGSAYKTLHPKNAKEALEIAYCACLNGFGCFADLTLLNYLMNTFPSKEFPLLHLYYVAQAQPSLITGLISRYLSTTKPSFVQESILFQVFTSLSESNQEIPPAIQKEIQTQQIQGTKCFQFISRFWSACYKGDIALMAKQAFLMHELIKNLDNTWRQLIMRYPYSIPLLNEYIHFLNTSGSQHKKAETIRQNRLIAAGTSGSELSNSDDNIMLSIAVEEAVHRRPIHTSTNIIVTVAFAGVFSVIMLIVGPILAYSKLQTFGLENTCLSALEKLKSYCFLIPTLCDDLTYHIEDSRRLIYYYATIMNNDLYYFLNNAEKNVLKKSDRIHLPFTFHMKTTSIQEDSYVINTFSVFTYYAQSLAFVPISDELQFKRYNDNIENCSELATLLLDTLFDTINEHQGQMDLIAICLYVTTWGTLFILFVPLALWGVHQLKKELKYIFSIYLSIPRATIQTFVEIFNGTTPPKTTKILKATKSSVHGQKGGNISQNKSAMFGFQPKQSQGQNQNQQDPNEPKEANTADGFKTIVGDSGGAVSVLPAGFVSKLFIVFFSICGIVCMLVTVSAVISQASVRELIKCFNTHTTISKRTTDCAYAMHGVTTCGVEFSAEASRDALQRAKNYHTALIYSATSEGLSRSALESKKIDQIIHNDPCNKTLDPKCRGLILLFDEFYNSIAKYDAELIEEEERHVDESEKDSMIYKCKDPKDDVFVDIRRMFIENLYPTMDAQFTAVVDHTNDYIATRKIIIFVIMGVGLVFLGVILFTVVLPIVQELLRAVDAVKLPLMFIPPLTIPDCPSLLGYLQGESDWNSAGLKNEDNFHQGGNVVLDAMMCPLAVFESDLLLLFANKEFYHLLGTTREASVGLHLNDIFRTIMPYEKDESHPFNALLDTVKQLQRGTSALSFAEIKTVMKVPGRPETPIKIRMIGMEVKSDEKDAAKEDETALLEDIQEKLGGKEKGEGASENIIANMFAFFLTNLSEKKEMEEKTNTEIELSQKLIDTVLPKILWDLLYDPVTQKMVVRHYPKLPLLMLTVKPKDNNDDLNDDYLLAVSAFAHSVKDLLKSFSTVVKLMHIKQSYVFTAGLTADPQENAEDFNFSFSELILFGIQVIDVVTSNNPDAVISGCVHLGDSAIVPLDYDLPGVEIYGDAWEDVKLLSGYVPPNKLIATDSVHSELQLSNSLVFNSVRMNINGTKKTLYEVIHKNQIDTQFSNLGDFL